MFSIIFLSRKSICLTLFLFLRCAFWNLPFIFEAQINYSINSFILLAVINFIHINVTSIFVWFITLQIMTIIVLFSALRIYILFIVTYIYHDSVHSYVVKWSLSQVNNLAMLPSVEVSTVLVWVRWGLCLTLLHLHIGLVFLALIVACYWGVSSFSSFELRGWDLLRIWVWFQIVKRIIIMHH